MIDRRQILTILAVLAGPLLAGADDGAAKADKKPDPPKDVAAYREFLLQADRALSEEGGADSARAILDLCPKDMRRFEWHYLYAKANQRVITLTGHEERVRCAAFSPDGKTLASGGEDKTVKLWDLQTGKVRFTLKAHEDRVSAVAFHPDGKTLASGSWDQTIKLWDVATGKPRAMIPENKELVHALAYSPDGAYLAVIDHVGNLRIIDMASSKTKAMLREDGTPDVKCMDFSPDGKLLAAGNRNGGISVWSVPDFRVVRRFAAHRWQVTGLAFLPDGTSLVSGGHDGNIHLWEAPRGRLLRSLTDVRVTDPAPISSLVAAPQGIAFAALISRGQKGQVWRDPFDRARQFFEAETVWSFVAFHPSGHILATEGTGSTIKLFHYADDTATLQAPEPVWAVHAGKSEFLVAMRKDAAALTPGSDGAGGLKGHKGTVRAIAAQPQGQLVATAGVDRLVKVWDARSRAELHSMKGHQGLVRGLAFSPDGKHLASASEDKTVKIWDAVAGTEVKTLQGHKGIVTSVVYLPGGLLASSGGDGAIRIWNLATGQNVKTWTGHEDIVSYIALSPDGKRLASAGTDRTIRIWDAAAGKTLHTMKSHTALVQSLAFSPDGKRLASGGGMGGVTLWDPEAGQPVYTFTRNAGPLNAVSFSPDGTVLSSGSFDGTVVLWKGRPRE